MLINKNDETIDLLDSFPKYEKYKKLYGRGNNFDFKFIITPETRGDEAPGLNYNGTVDWQELRYVYKVSRVDLVELIEKKSVIHTYKSPDSDTKMYRGKINFVNREPTEEEWNKQIKELKKSDRKFWLIVGAIILIAVLYFNK